MDADLALSVARVEGFDGKRPDHTKGIKLPEALVEKRKELNSNLQKNVRGEKRRAEKGKGIGPSKKSKSGIGNILSPSSKYNFASQPSETTTKAWTPLWRLTNEDSLISDPDTGLEYMAHCTTARDMHHFLNQAPGMLESEVAHYFAAASSAQSGLLARFKLLQKQVNEQDLRASLAEEDLKKSQTKINDLQDELEKLKLSAADIKKTETTRDRYKRQRDAYKAQVGDLNSQLAEKDAALAAREKDFKERTTFDGLAGAVIGVKFTMRKGGHSEEEIDKVEADAELIAALKSGMEPLVAEFRARAAARKANSNKDNPTPAPGSPSVRRNPQVVHSDSDEEANADDQPKDGARDNEVVKTPERETPVDGDEEFARDLEKELSKGHEEGKSCQPE